MLAQLKQDDSGFVAVKTPAWRPTLVRSTLWDQVEAPKADWAKANPERLMTYLMVAQSDFGGLEDLLA
jgi:hypothetical protein